MADMPHEKTKLNTSASSKGPKELRTLNGVGKDCRHKKAKQKSRGAAAAAAYPDGAIMKAVALAGGPTASRCPSALDRRKIFTRL